MQGSFKGTERMPLSEQLGVTRCPAACPACWHHRFLTSHITRKSMSQLSTLVCLLPVHMQIVKAYQCSVWSKKQQEQMRREVRGSCRVVVGRATRSRECSGALCMFDWRLHLQCEPAGLLTSMLGSRCAVVEAPLRGSVILTCWAVLSVMLSCPVLLLCRVLVAGL